MRNIEKLLTADKLFLKANGVALELFGKGIGQTIRKNLKINLIDENNISLEFYEESRECLLILIPGLVEGKPEIKMPFFLFPDGTVEIALQCEEKDENGNWKPIDLWEYVMSVADIAEIKKLLKAEDGQ